MNASHIDPEIELVREFVNTRDVEEGTDEIGDPTTLASWIGDATSMRIEQVGAGEHARALALRESLRGMLLANNGAGPAPDLDGLREAAANARVGVSLAGDRVRLGPAANGFGAFESRLLLAVSAAQERGAWTRLKACTADDCQWAFYDDSRNRSRTWCSMDVCGNRSKTRSYRKRKAGR